jgi:hypothetical protein
MINRKKEVAGIFIRLPNERYFEKKLLPPTTLGGF